MNYKVVGSIQVFIKKNTKTQKKIQKKFRMIVRKDSVFRWKYNDDNGPYGICFSKYSNKEIVKNNYGKLINYIKNDYPIIFIEPLLLGDD